MSLFKMWEDAYVNKKLPKEWEKWDKFRAWAIKNNYKAEYGFKGEFNPDGCLKAMPGYEENEKDKIEKPKTQSKSKKKTTAPETKGGKNG